MNDTKAALTTLHKALDKATGLSGLEFKACLMALQVLATATTPKQAAPAKEPDDRKD